MLALNGYCYSNIYGVVTIYVHCCSAILRPVGCRDLERNPCSVFAPFLYLGGLRTAYNPPKHGGEIW